MRFEWDPDKNALNQRKHGIAFADAARVFQAESECLDIFDEAHSDSEERFITIGPLDGELVLVVWTEREMDTIRIISARWATHREHDLYRRQMESNR